MNNNSQKKKNEQKMIKDRSDLPKTDDDDEDLDYNDLKTMKINK
jgi:hypothetical protein